ncbi:MAG: hypothetical protein ACJ0BV_11605 [Paracoccaceae bacterium]
MNTKYTWDINPYYDLEERKKERELTEKLFKKGLKHKSEEELKKFNEEFKKIEIKLKEFKEADVKRLKERYQKKVKGEDAKKRLERFKRISLAERLEELELRLQKRLKEEYTKKLVEEYQEELKKRIS